MACDRVRGEGPPFSSVYAYMLHGDELVLDLRGVGFMDTSGLRYTLELNERAERDGWRLRLVRGPRPVQRVFDVAGLAPRLHAARPGAATGPPGVPAHTR